MIHPEGVFHPHGFKHRSLGLKNKKLLFLAVHKWFCLMINPRRAVDRTAMTLPGAVEAEKVNLVLQCTGDNAASKKR